MDQKTISAIQKAFQQAMDVFQSSLLEALGNTGNSVLAVPSASKKGRGRPRKVKPELLSVPSEKKRRGRPAKKVDVAAKMVATSEKKRRGRPKKS